MQKKIYSEAMATDAPTTVVIFSIIAQLTVVVLYLPHVLREIKKLNYKFPHNVYVVRCHYLTYRVVNMGSDVNIHFPICFLI